MKSTRIKNLLLFFIMLTVSSYGQYNTYDNLKIKEEYDAFTSNITWNVCSIDPNSTAVEAVYGDGTSLVLDGYIRMYKTTKDKAYLYKFVIQSLCMLSKRKDYAGIHPNEPRWASAEGDNAIYRDGLIIGAMAHFVYYILQENPVLINEPLHQFNEITSIAGSSPFNQAFNTWGSYAYFLGSQVNQTLSYYLTNNYMGTGKGFNRVNDSYPMEINQQVGFARALFYIGEAIGDNTSIGMGKDITSLYQSSINYVDFCAAFSYDEPLLRINANNSYWWYHRGWRLAQYKCAGFIGSMVSDYQYRQYIEDISHATTDLLLPEDYYNYDINNGYFDANDMVRFRNTFVNNIYNANDGTFHKGVDGNDSPIYPGDPSHPTSNETFQWASLGWTFLEQFDGYSGATGSYNVYDIILNFYTQNIANQSYSSHYSGIQSKGHADLVKAQWDRECVNLSLYNRDLVYDQDFFVKNTLTFEPTVQFQNNPNSYADPVIINTVFTIESGVTSNITAGEKIVFKDGFTAKAGCTMDAKIITSACTDGHRMANSSTIGLNTPTQNNIIIPQKNNENLSRGFHASIYPNPSSGVFTIELNNEKDVTIEVYDMLGNKIQSVEKGEKQTIHKLDLSGYEKGMYMINIITNSKQTSKKIILE